MSIPVQFSHDAEGRPVLTLSVNEMMIHDPRLSLCGRFEVNPICDYGIPDDLADAVRVINKYIDICQ
jgi:hypothetical protein